MERSPIQSSNIASAGYDPEAKVLELTFLSQPEIVYSYLHFPKELYDLFLEAESKGVFFSKNIKPYYTMEKRS